jgi:predicted dehydrogenase
LIVLIGVGVLGAGWWGPNVIRSLLSLPNCCLVRACDARPGRLQYVQERFPQVEVTPDYEDLLRDPRLDAICIVTPIHTHHDLALRALDSGRHVFVEKPLAATSEQAQEIVERAAARNRVLAVGHLFVYHPAIVRLREEIVAGRLGRLCYLHSERVNLGPPTAEVDVIWDLAVHDVAIALYLASQQPAEVIAYGQRYVRPALLDMALLVLRYADGTLSHHHVSWLSPNKVRRFFAAGTDGSALFDARQEPKALTLFGQGFDTRLGARDDQAIDLTYGTGDVRVPDLPPIEPLAAECQHFLECIETGRQPRADGLAGLQVVQILEAAGRSVALGSQAVELPPVPHPLSSRG